MCIGSVVLLLGWLISILLSQVTAIHPGNATEYQLTLKRVSPAFVEAVLEHRENRKDEVREEEDYREHFQPCRSRPRRRDQDEDRIERS